MINEILQDSSYKPKGTYILALCCLLITAGTMMFPNLDSFYGAKEPGGVPMLVRLTVPFQHGFDFTSRAVHVAIMIILFALIARPVEKVIGTFRFLAFTVGCWAIYALTHRLLELQGHGFHPILWAYSVVVWYILGEAKFIKTRSSFQENYRLLRGIILLMWIAAPLMMIFIPLHFKNSHEISLVESAYYGNILHVLGFVLGIIGVVIFRQAIRKRMLSFARKKKFATSSMDQLAFYAALLIPVCLLSLVFILR